MSPFALSSSPGVSQFAIAFVASSSSALHILYAPCIQRALLRPTLPHTRNIENMGKVTFSERPSATTRLSSGGGGILRFQSIVAELLFLRRKRPPSGDWRAGISRATRTIRPGRPGRSPAGRAHPAFVIPTKAGIQKSPRTGDSIGQYPTSHSFRLRRKNRTRHGYDAPGGREPSQRIRLRPAMLLR